jgi:hypothetical protein
MKIKRLLSTRNSIKTLEKHQSKNDASKRIKTYNRAEKRDGYNPGQDEKVYEGIKGSGIVTSKQDFNYQHDQKLKKEKLDHIKKFIPDKKIDWSKMNRKNSYNPYETYEIKEGFYKNKDIENQESSRKEKDKLISMYMDKLAKSQHHITPEAKKQVLKKMKDLSEEEILEAYEQFDEDHEPYKIKQGKVFQKAGVLVGKKTKTNYVGDVSKYPLKPRKDLEPNLNIWKYNDKDEKYELKDLNKGKKSTKKGFFAKMFHKEDVAISALEYLEEGLFSNIKNRMTGRRDDVNFDLALKSMKHNLNSSNANLRLTNHILTKMNKGKGPLSKKEYDEIKALQSRESAVGSSLFRKSKDLSKTKNYFTGKGRLKEEESLDEGVSRSIKRFLLAKHNKKNAFNKTNKDYDDRAEDSEKAWNNYRKANSSTETGKKDVEIFRKRNDRDMTLGRRLSALKNHGKGNVFMPSWPKKPADLKYLSGKGLSGSQKSLKRFGDTAKSSDDNYYVKNSKR